MEDSDFSEGVEEEDGEEEEQLDPDNPEHYFLIMERNFNKVFTEMEQNPEAAVFADDYTKLFEAFFQEYTKSNNLESEKEEMQKEMENKNQKLLIAIQLTESDKNTIDELKENIQHAWKLADAAHAREQAAQEIIDNLRKQVENLNNEIDLRNKMAQDSENGESAKNKDGLERERERLLNEVAQLNVKLVNAIDYQEELEQKTSLADMKINEFTGIIEDQNNEIARYKRGKEAFEADIADYKTKLADKDLKITELKSDVDSHVKIVFKLEQDLRDQRISCEKIAKELENAIKKFGVLQGDYNNTVCEIDKLQRTVNEKTNEFKLAKDEAVRLKADISKLLKVRDVLEKKILLLVSEKDEVISDRTSLRHRISILEREIDELKKIIDEYKRTVEAITKEKEIQLKQIQRQQAVQADSLKLIHIQEQTKKKLELELDTLFIESGKQKKLLSQLERERDRLAEEQVEFNQTVQDQLEDIKEKKDLIFDLKKTAAEQENYLRQQQNQYELMRSNRNALQKSLQESLAEGVELKKKLKLLFHQIEQLKEDNGMKEKQLIKDENIIRKLNKEKEDLKIEVMSGLHKIRNLKFEVKELTEDRLRLNKEIQDQKATIKEQSRTIDQLINEKDILGSQLVRRNDEICLLNNKIAILQSTLGKGEIFYNQRLGDIRLLKLEIKRLRQERNIMSKSMNSMADLRQEIFHLERDLTRSRLKCKALEQEVQNPLNVHRWRKLEGSDPETMGLLQKIQILQKRLLRKGSEAIERERQLKEAEKLYLNLRQLVAKQPGPLLQDELNRIKRELKKKTEKLKCCVSELNMTETKASDYKSDLDRLCEELKELKRKYFAEKKAHRALRMHLESGRETSHLEGAVAGSPASSDPNNAEVKFTGGGFRMSVQRIANK